MSDPSSYSTAPATQMPAPGGVRPEMIGSAISFLSDPKVQSASMSQRVSFLESKGLNPQEIDEAIRQSGQAAVAGPANYSHAAQQPPTYYSQPNHQRTYPPNQQQGRDWRDWFIMAVVSGTIGYGVISLAKKYLMPHLQPPNANVLEADLDALTAKYDQVAAQLQALDAQTLAVKQGLDEQREEIEKSIKEVEDCVKAARENEKKRDDEMDQVKREVEQIRRELGSMFEKTKQAQTNSLSELQTELKSLKSLLVSRGSMGVATATTATSNALPQYSVPPRPYGVGGYNASGYGTSPSNSTPGQVTPPPLPKPSIPSWQLTEATSSTSISSTKASEPESTDAISSSDPLPVAPVSSPPAGNEPPSDDDSKARETTDA